MPTTFAKDIGVRVHKLACLMGRAAEQRLRVAGDLTFAQFRILIALLHGAKLNQRTIAQYHGLTEPAVSRMLATLQRHKLVHLAQDPTSRRTNQLTLTPQGKRIAEHAAHLLEGQFTKAFQKITTVQRHSLLKTLDILIQGLSA